MKVEKGRWKRQDPRKELDDECGPRELSDTAGTHVVPFGCELCSMCLDRSSSVCELHSRISLDDDDSTDYSRIKAYDNFKGCPLVRQSTQLQIYLSTRNPTRSMTTRNNAPADSLKNPPGPLYLRTDTH